MHEYWRIAELMKASLDVYRHNALYVLHLWAGELQFSIANVLTFSRAFFAALLLVLWFNEGLFVSEKTRFSVLILIYIAASVSDYFDGYFARKRNLSSNLGKFFDPLFDKIFVLSVFLGYLFYTPLNVPGLFIGIICARELLITMIRVLSLLKNYPLETERHAKIKTFTHMVSQSFIWLILWIYAFSYETRSFQIFFEESMRQSGLEMVALPPLEDLPRVFLEVYFQGVFESKEILVFLLDGPNSFVFISMLVSLASGTLYLVRNRQIFYKQAKRFV